MKLFQSIVPVAVGAFTALAVLGFTRIQTQAPAEKKHHRVVFQVATNDTLAYRALARQINNVLSAWPEAQIEVVAHNRGLGMLQTSKSNVAPEVQGLAARGIQFMACEQSMLQQRLEKTDMLSSAGYVQRGIVEIIEKQEDGWSYIKAGF